MAIKVGQKDTCATCEQPIIYASFLFWADTKEVVPAGPEYPKSLNRMSGAARTEAEQAAEKAYENWQEYKRTRGTVNHLGNESRHAIHRETWMHIRSWPIEKIDDVSYHCFSREENFWSPHAVPASFCMEFQSAAGGYCTRRAKEVVVTGRFKRNENDKDTVETKKGICGLHLSHLRRAARKEEEREQQLALADWAKEEAERICRELKPYGIKAEAEWQRHYTGPLTGSYTGKIVVENPQELLEILQNSVELFDA